LWLGGREVIAGHLSLGEFVAFLAYLSMLTWPTIAAGWVINIFQRGAASMSRMLEILETPPEIRDDPAVTVPEQIRGSVAFHTLSFRYAGSGPEVLRDVRLQVPAGKTLAIVGHTGSGKSTLVDLLPRLFDPPPGTVLVDGQDVRLWPLSSLRRLMGYVPQETFLFSDTIRENIAFGRDGDATDEEIEAAAQVSQIRGDIQQLPQKYQTFVGERGITLSGGQKQRVAISRAILVDPKILILDDALSSVDTYTEEQILKELAKVRKDRTTILISHRISTVQNADEIIVLQYGVVVERGTHSSLIALQGVYASLYQKQLLEEELASA
jgi:ATP-binding cassette subfamily B protein